MVTIRPIPKTEIRCNACGELMGYLTKELETENLYFQELKNAKGRFQRIRIYDVMHDGEHLYDHEYEVDFCNDCTEKFGKIIKKFGLTESKVDIAKRADNYEM